MDPIQDYMARRKGRIDGRPRNVYRGANGRRVIMPTSAQISGGRAPASFYQSRARKDNIAKAKANGSFAQTRFDFNKKNAGKYTMDNHGTISKAVPPPKVKPPTTPAPVTAKASPAPPNSGPRPEGIINGKPSSEFFKSRVPGRIRDETGDRTKEITDRLKSKSRLDKFKGVEAIAKAGSNRSSDEKKA